MKPTELTCDPELFTPPQVHDLRGRYSVRGVPKPNRPGTWNSTVVEVLDVDGDVVAEFVRTYPTVGPFEPFEFRGRPYALVAPSYTCVSVVDLTTGDVVAEEHSDVPGFCPVECYVPQWWDVHDESEAELWGTEGWDMSLTWPRGEFGFVAGCHWGDDWCWKVQHLDLSRIDEGVVSRDDRYGYVMLPYGMRLADAVHIDDEMERVAIATPVVYDLRTAKVASWSKDHLVELAGGDTT